MKVKEAFSPEFKKDSGERILKKSADSTLKLKEEFDYSGEHIYSRYTLLKDNKPIFLIEMPDPLYSKAIEKNFYLKYQNGTRYFLKDLYDFLKEGGDIPEALYYAKQKPDLDYKTIKNYVLLILNDKAVGFVDLNNKEKSEKLASNFINLFQGTPLKYEWAEVK